MSTDLLDRSRSGEAITARFGYIESAAFELLPAYEQREGFMIQNSADVPLYVQFGAEPDGQTYSFKIPSQGFYESGTIVFTGVIYGIFVDAGTGDVLTTDFRK